MPRPGLPHVEEGHDYCSRLGRAAVWGCGCEGLKAGMTPCTRLDCAQCYRRNAKRRAECQITTRSKDVLGKPFEEERQMDGVGWAFGVFTLPEALHRRIGWSQLNALRKAAWRAFEDFCRIEWGVAVGGYAVVHPGGDQCAKCGKAGPRSKGENAHYMDRLGRCWHCGTEAAWKPHVHVGAPRVGRLDDGTLREIPHYLSPSQLRRWWHTWAAAVRGIWSAAGHDTSKWLFDGASDQPLASWPEYARVKPPHWSYRNPGVRLQHRWRYDRRPWPAWEAARPRHVQGASLSPQWYGLAASRNGQRAVAWRAAVTGAQVVREPHRCPDCGEEYQYKGSWHLGGRDWEYMSRVVVEWLHGWPDHPLVPPRDAREPRATPPAPAAAVELYEDWDTW